MGLDLSLPGGSFDAVHSCYLDPDNKKMMGSFEMKQYRKRHVEERFNSECIGLDHCRITFQFSDFAMLPPKL